MDAINSVLALPKVPAHLLPRLVDCLLRTYPRKAQAGTRVPFRSAMMIIVNIIVVMTINVLIEKKKIQIEMDNKSDINAVNRMETNSRY
ncbi:uncharacterized protein BO87DRAFT_84133 [Aspergillus neoniger CBS 115656]|uniref:Uncharacterized protein n=1 Tax=Aspergillus neoniger (strain CBS 115656) TaxID=1448310 RepID=A0A318YFQ2_ASPNB|nr:hypothetical protein BO87DRAFT_84133 [Aspergillus neoniger CBS 115656]PYH33206.1 hypothetical protein BO87DRAFT_84133 [Aspergillus neoniger CBS 115656]